MYLIEWGLWQTAIESKSRRKANEAGLTPAERRASQDLYEGDLEKDVHFRPVSETAHTRGPVFDFNDTLKSGAAAQPIATQGRPHRAAHNSLI